MMKQRRDTPARSVVGEVEDTDQPPGLFDNPFHIRSEGDETTPPPSGPAALPAEPEPEADRRDALAGAAAVPAEPEPVPEADRRDALDLTTVQPHASTTPHGATAVRPSPGFLPSTPPRLGVESALVRIIATAGVVAIGTAVGAGLVATDVEGWIVGLVVSLVSVLLAAVLWRSRRL